MTAVPETKYAKSGDLHIAYQAIGTGSFDLVFMHGWISHIEHMWEEPRIARFLDRLASFARLIVLDKRGTRLSDPVPLDRLPTLEERMDDLRAVMDAVGSERAALMGTSEAGALSLLFAATYPSRTSALVLLNSYARLAYATDYVHGIPVEQAQGLLQAIEEGWGKGVAFEALVASQADNAPVKSWWSRYQRRSSIHSAGSDKEAAMHVMGRIGFMGLGIALVGCLSGAPVFAADKPVEDGSKIMITSPKDGDTVSDSFDLKYEFTKGSQAVHAHVFLDNQYQRGFTGAFKGLSRGTHQITVTGATEDHALDSATQTITIEVQ